MDKISSYPSGLLEADARAESYWAPCAQSPERPSDWRLRESYGPKLLGPIAHSLGKPSQVAPTSAVGRPMALIVQAQHLGLSLIVIFPDLNQFQICTNFYKCGNFQNYLFN